MILLFIYLSHLPNDTDLTSRCIQFIFGDKVAATCLNREPVTRKEGKGKGKKSPKMNCMPRDGHVGVILQGDK